MPRINWKETQLGDLISIKHGFAFPGKNITDLETDNILVTPGHFNIGGGFKNVHKKFFNGDIDEEYILEEGDLIITMTDLSKEGETLGYSAIVPKLKNKKLLHNQRIGKVKINNPDIKKSFLNYLLRDKHYRHWILSTSTGSTVRHTSPSRIEEFKFFLPPIEEQSNIAEVLLSLDSKIDLNQKMNETLEEIAKTLFKSWFIDFDPVRAKAEGRPTGLSKEISDLFPDSFEDSELGDIPSGWKVRSLGDFYAVNKGLSYKGKFLTEHGMPMINLGCFGGNGIFLKKKIKPYSGEFKERHIISKGDIAIANTDMTQNRITLGSPIIVDEIDGNCDFIFTHHVFCLKNISEREDLKYFTYQTLLNPRFRGIAGNYATGTTVLALPKDAIENLQVALPSKQILNAFNEIAGLNFKKSKINYEESIVLGDLRDKLLPKLISGELKISDAENLIDEAGI